MTRFCFIPVTAAHRRAAFVGVALLGAAFFIEVPLALAQDAGKRDADNRADRAAVFDRIDSDHDGIVSRDEVPEAQRNMFDRLVKKGDKNSDGKLSREEFLAATADESPRPGAAGSNRGDLPSDADAEPLFRRADANGDNRLEESEIPDDKREVFRMMLQRVDGDGDKKLSLDEFRRGLAILRGDANPAAPAPDRKPRDTMSPGDSMQPGPAGGERLFQALDTDRDGRISREEMYASPENLKKLDGNQDGFVDRAEALGPPGEMMARGGDRPTVRPDQPAGAAGGGPMVEMMLTRFRESDADKDGKLSKEEAPDRMKENFDRVDRNGDGFIDEDEMRAVATMLSRNGAPGQPGRPNPDQPRPGRPGEGERRPNPEQLLKQLDKNNDGKLSKDEVPERMQEMFDRLDRNGDGFVDAEELKALGQRRPAGDN